MKSAKRAWIYCRVKYGEEQDVLNEQHQRLVSYAVGKGLLLAGSSSDISCGPSGKQAGLEQALKAAMAGEMEVLLIWSIGALGRKGKEVIGLINDFSRCGVELLSMTGGRCLTLTASSLLDTMELQTTPYLS